MKKFTCFDLVNNIVDSVLLKVYSLKYLKIWSIHHDSYINVYELQKILNATRAFENYVFSRNRYISMEINWAQTVILKVCNSFFLTYKISCDSNNEIIINAVILSHSNEIFKVKRKLQPVNKHRQWKHIRCVICSRKG